MHYSFQNWNVFLFPVSPCVNNPCENNGTCSVDVNGNASCTCDGNWNGTYCQGNCHSNEISKEIRGSCGCDRMVVGFTST